MPCVPCVPWLNNNKEKKTMMNDATTPPWIDTEGELVIGNRKGGAHTNH